MDGLAANVPRPVVALEVAVAAVVALACYWFFYNPKPSWKIPTRAPLEIALTTYLVQRGGIGRRIYSLIRRYNGSLFGIFKDHQVLIDLPNLDRFMSQSHATLESGPTQLTLIMRVFGAEDTPELVNTFNQTAKALTNVVEKEFVTEAASTAALQRGHVEEKMASLVTFTDAAADMKIWERCANVKVLQSGVAGAVEADMMVLMRDFGASVAIPVLYGKDFVSRYPNLLEDFWKFDNDIFPLLMIGIPEWAPLKIMKDGLAARKRLIAAMEGVYRRIDQYQNGEPVDFGADMSDVGVTATERNKIYAKHNISYKLRGDMDFSFLWGLNGNTQPLLFWYILYAYSTPGLVDKFMEEMAPYIKISTAKGAVEVQSIDITALNRECPLMKSALFETFRLASEPTSIRRVAKPLTVVDGDYKHELQPGSYISAPYAVIQNDPSVYPDPEKFDPERFLELDQTGKKVARYGRLRPWAVGGGACKGRTFAEKEILTLAACMISMWEIQPATGKWTIPPMIPGTGAKRPANDIRVILRRRFHN